MSGGLWQDPLRLLDHLEIGVIVLDSQQRVRVWNRWLHTHGDFGLVEVLGRPLLECCPQLEGSRLLVAIESALEHRLASLLSPGLNRAPLPLYQRPQDMAEDLRMRQLIHVAPLPGDERGCLIQITDVTASLRREDQLRSQSTALRERNETDLLTGVGNRRKFDEALKTEFRRAVRGGTPLSLLMLDLDQFRAFNTKFGMESGDVCLRLVARALQDVLRDSGDFVARYGGEEFAVVLPGATTAAASQVAERLRERVETMAREQDQARAITISIGVAAVTPDSQMALDSLISGADMALYQAKADGRNRVAAFSLDDGSLATLARDSC